MKKNKNIFEDILTLLQEKSILKDLIIIGGWCLIIYRHLYNNPKEISSLRTSDIDFLVPLDQKFSRQVDIGEILSKLEFDSVYSISKGFIKYVHPEMEIEFLVPAIGRPTDKPYKLDALKSNAQPLRYLDILSEHTRSVSYKHFEVRIPEPAAFVMNKLITAMRRSELSKQEKDLKSAKELGEYILDDNNQKALLIKIFNRLNSRLQNRLLKQLKDTSPRLHEFLSY
jgi:hypothetical protein